MEKQPPFTRAQGCPRMGGTPDSMTMFERIEQVYTRGHEARNGPKQAETGGDFQV